MDCTILLTFLELLFKYLGRKPHSYMLERFRDFNWYACEKKE